jgi:hypothetical protein
MKQDEIQSCLCCGKGVMHDGAITFYRVALERMVIDVRAVQRQHGLELVIGSPVIARVMGPDADLAKSLDDPPLVVLICDECAMLKTRPLAALHEDASDRAPRSRRRVRSHE